MTNRQLEVVDAGTWDLGGCRIQRWIQFIRVSSGSYLVGCDAR